MVIFLGTRFPSKRMWWHAVAHIESTADPHEIFDSLAKPRVESFEQPPTIHVYAAPDAIVPVPYQECHVSTLANAQQSHRLDETLSMAPAIPTDDGSGATI